MTVGIRAKNRLRLLRQTIDYFRKRGSFSVADLQVQWPLVDIPTSREITSRLKYYQKELGVQRIGTNHWRFV